MKSCSNCGSNNPKYAIKCKHCGMLLTKSCSYCGMEIPEDAAKCNYCGNKLPAETNLELSKPSGIWWFLFSLDGRINRSQFWLGSLIIIMGLLVLSFIITAIREPTNNNVFFNISMIVGMVLIWWMGQATSIKRLHDINQSGWAILWILVPILGQLYLCWLFVQICFLKGSDGPNKYGYGPGTIRGK